MKRHKQPSLRPAQAMCRAIGAPGTWGAVLRSTGEPGKASPQRRREASPSEWGKRKLGIVVALGEGPSICPSRAAAPTLAHLSLRYCSGALHPHVIGSRVQLGRNHGALPLHHSACLTPLGWCFPSGAKLDRGKKGGRGRSQGIVRQREAAGLVIPGATDVAGLW